jgi:CubicO group peptidase (beta-lactamase class C family)
MLFRILILIFSFCTIVCPTIFTQALPDSTDMKINQIFSEWNTDNTPGCTVGVVLNGKLVYEKGFGMANLEYNIRNTPSTLYHVASISKQFTAYSIIMLAQQGKLALDDDIRIYLPWFPQLDKTITVRNLLNHTSGIRDAFQLLALAGTRINDVITQEQIIKVLSHQRSLNFQPGDKYAYSNSNYMLLAEIVRSVTGKSLRQFADSAIFRPLGMLDTHFRDDYTEIDPDRALSYDRLDSVHFANSLLNYSTAGATGLLTNIPDMGKWVTNLLNPRIGDATTVATLTRVGVLNSGAVSDYAAGIIIEPYKGLRQWWHNGSDAGFRSNEIIFPDQGLGIFVFANEGDFDVRGKTYEIADLLLAGPIKMQLNARRGNTTSVLRDNSPYQKFEGYYLDEDGREFSIGIRNGIMYYNNFEKNNFLIQDSIDTFSLLTAPDIKFRLHSSERDTTVTISSSFLYFYLTKDKKDINDLVQPDSLLLHYPGTYYNSELDSKYGIVLKDHTLYLTNSKYDDTPLILVNTNNLTCQYWWISHLTMTRDAKGKIMGFEVNSGRGVRHLLFTRIDENGRL